MIIYRSYKDFKFRHRSKKNLIIYTSKKVKNDEEVINLILNNFGVKNLSSKYYKLCERLKNIRTVDIKGILGKI